MEVIKNHKGFKIIYKNREIISHTEDSPCLFIGKGDATYEMYRGNFDIKEELKEKLPLKNFKIKKDKKKIEIKFSYEDLNPVRIVFHEEEKRLSINFKDAPKEINRLWFRVKAQKDEYVYGGGEQFSHFNLRGRNFPLWVSEQGVGRNKNSHITFLADVQDKAGGDYYTTFFPQPTFISSEKYFCHVMDSSYINLDFSHKEFHELCIWGIPEVIIIGAENTYEELLTNLTELLGRQPELPEWVYKGVWLGIQGGTERVLEKLKEAEEMGVKVSAIWAQDWQGKRITSFGKRLQWNWLWDSELYPELPRVMKELEEKGVNFLGYINPYLVSDGSLYMEASEKGYMVKNNLYKDYLIDAGEFDIGIVDLTNPKAFKWYKEVIKKNMIAFGLKGWMADFGEYLPVDSILHNGVSGEKIHNIWPVLWAKVNREAIEESGKLGEVVFFMRSGYSESGGYSTMTWGGDQNVDWSLDDGIASVIPAALSLGMSGMGLHHSDIGGYTTLFEMKRSKELFMRWAEMAAFTPIMRTHEGNRPEMNWQFHSDEETLIGFGRISEVYTRLAPYIKETVKENSQKGIPVIRPLFLHYEEDRRAYEIQYEYLLGRDILVAPVIEEGKRSWSVYLPMDTWVHLWSGKEFRGGEIEVDAPIGEPPVFYRRESKYVDLFEEIGERV